MWARPMKAACPAVFVRCKLTIGKKAGRITHSGNKKEIAARILAQGRQNHVEIKATLAVVLYPFASFADRAGLSITLSKL